MESHIIDSSTVLRQKQIKLIRVSHQVSHQSYKKGFQYFPEQREFPQDDCFCLNNSTKKKNFSVFIIFM